MADEGIDQESARNISLKEKLLWITNVHLDPHTYIRLYIFYIFYLSVYLFVYWSVYPSTVYLSIRLISTQLIDIIGEATKTNNRWDLYRPVSLY